MILCRLYECASVVQKLFQNKGNLNLVFLAHNQYDIQGAWDCGQIYTGSSWGGWETDDCYKIQAFMCEIAPGAEVGVSVGRETIMT